MYDIVESWKDGPLARQVTEIGQLGKYKKGHKESNFDRARWMRWIIEDMKNNRKNERWGRVTACISDSGNSMPTAIDYKSVDWIESFYSCPENISDFSIPERKKEKKMWPFNFLESWNSWTWKRHPLFASLQTYLFVLELFNVHKNPYSFQLIVSWVRFPVFARSRASG